MENPTTIAIDLSKSVFEIAVEREGRICQRKRLSRGQMITFLSRCPRATVLMETCGSAHDWGRKAQEFGHEVRLLPAQRVARNRIGNKTDRRDTIPGEGLLNATAFSAMVGNFPRFKSGRKFASSLGLTPKESSSGKRRWLGSISKAGDPYLRTLLIGGARSMLLSAHRTKRPHDLQRWALDVENRCGRNRAAVAVANKLARVIWAVATRGERFKARFEIQNAPKSVPA